MPNTISNFFAPVRPYDSSSENNFAMYDNMSYKRDLSVCSDDMIKMHTGNVLKMYHYNNSQPLCINNNNVPIPQKETPVNGFVETDFSDSSQLTEHNKTEEYSQESENE